MWRTGWSAREQRKGVRTCAGPAGWLGQVCCQANVACELWQAPLSGHAPVMVQCRGCVDVSSIWWLVVVGVASGSWPKGPGEQCAHCCTHSPPIVYIAAASALAHPQCGCIREASQGLWTAACACSHTFSLFFVLLPGQPLPGPPPASLRRGERAVVTFAPLKPALVTARDECRALGAFVLREKRYAVRGWHLTRACCQIWLRCALHDACCLRSASNRHAMAIR